MLNQEKQAKSISVYRSSGKEGGVSSNHYIFHIGNGIQAPPSKIVNEFALVATKKLPKFASRAPLSSSVFKGLGKII